MRRILEMFRVGVLDKEDSYLKMAQVEYRSEYGHLTKSLGRHPTSQEVRDIILSR